MWEEHTTPCFAQMHALRRSKWSQCRGFFFLFLVKLWISTCWWWGDFGRLHWDGWWGKDGEIFFVFNEREDVDTSDEVIAAHLNFFLARIKWWFTVECLKIVCSHSLFHCSWAVPVFRLSREYVPFQNPVNSTWCKQILGLVLPLKHFLNHLFMPGAVKSLWQGRNKPLNYSCMCIGAALLIEKF